ncbi:hypothetical protein OEZ86_003600 [Tetradesmus obliquus]|nr:hypothetical protein OEZ86_003600 [Tetradesmus obliquus]
MKEYDPLTARIIKQYSVANNGGRVRLIDGTRKQVDLSYHYAGFDAGSVSNITGFATKVHALAYVTSFQQVLMLDADSLPLLNPEQLFHSEPFAAAGNLFWPDFWGHLWMDGAFFSKLGQAVPWEQDATFHSAESGQVLFDRLRHYDVLEWLFWLNSRSNETYQHMHGDKDTYRLAFGLAGKLAQHRQVALQPRDAMAVVMPPGEMPYLQHQGMVQHTPDERPAFLHRTDKGKLFPHCSAKNSTSDCQVSYFTIPLTEGQAMLAMSQPNFTYTYSQVDTRTFEACRAKQRSAGVVVRADRPDDPEHCPELKEGLNLQPVPVVPVEAFSQAHRVLYASYVAFDRVKSLLAKGQQLLAEKDRLQQQQQQQGVATTR